MTGPLIQQRFALFNPQQVWHRDENHSDIPCNGLSHGATAKLSKSRQNFDYLIRLEYRESIQVNRECL